MPSDAHNTIYFYYILLIHIFILLHFVVLKVLNFCYYYLTHCWFVIHVNKYIFISCQVPWPLPAICTPWHPCCHETLRSSTPTREVSPLRPVMKLWRGLYSLTQSGCLNNRWDEILRHIQCVYRHMLVMFITH